MSIKLHVERGGRSGPSLLLLHGSGASAAVWGPVLAALARRGLPLRWITLDLPGHGRSERLPAYDHRSYAAAVAAALAPDRHIDLVVGHSLGGLIALTLADGTFGIGVGAVTAMSMKVRWSPEELAKRAAFAEKPVKVFPDRAAAAERFARVSGLAGVDGADLDSGIRACSGGYVLAADPRITADPPLSGSDLAELVGRATAPVRLVCGSADPTVQPADMSVTLGGRPVQVVPGAGHNLHVDLPAVVVGVIESQLPAVRRPG
ncbi:Pimeloyl-ACP methyl ester carboxylesterase [Pseudonocardia thermophila]|uniref:Pimeloyl-ACP methyl ester carboxylesterase n=1 Tax=Pseudonocardia thermophila TaxID=1848 RepID=A0A1M6Y093_PSETH|nr:alpha/beta hydrolase [Pseudonocardia thermophila]SHL11578.1 Pimeloyl-ACP methyl ester carboxylesterase [Pseudonocardia thermophila]